MSQYPQQPYQQQPYPQPYVAPEAGTMGYYYAADPYGQYLRPARRAGILMIVLASLGLLCGVCAGLMSTVVNTVALQPEQEAAFRQLAQFGITKAGVMIGIGVLAGGVSIVALVLGLLVRSGRKLWIYLSLVLSGLIVLGLGIETLGAVAQGALHGDPNALLGSCMIGAPTIAFIFLIVLLIQAARAASQLDIAKVQYQAQYSQYMQQQQAYAQAQGLGGYPQVPQPPGYHQPGAWPGYAGYPMQPGPGAPPSPQPPQPPPDQQPPTTGPQ